jgi:hypothetical protein
MKKVSIAATNEIRNFSERKRVGTLIALTFC